MADVLNPTDNNMPEPARLPRIGGAGRTPAGVPIPQTQGVTPEQMLERAASENEVANAENAAVSGFNPAAAIPYNPMNWTIDGTELYPSFDFDQTDIEAAGQLQDKFTALTAARESQSSILNTIGGTLSNLQQNQSNFGNWVPETAPGDYQLPDYTENAWANRALQQQNLTVAPGISNGLAGITRSYAQGLPMNSPAMQSTAVDFFRRTFGVDFTGIDSREEPTAPPTWVDRAQSALVRAGTTLGIGGPLRQVIDMVPGGTDTLNNLVPFANPEEPAAIRRLLGAAARVAGDRTNRRIEAVGLPQFLYENTIDRLNPARSDSLGRLLLRRGNPVAAFEFLTNVDTGIAPGVLTPQPQAIRPALPSGATTSQGLPAAIPGRIDMGDPGFFGELMRSSPEARNLVRGLEPVINEAGIVGFNPAQGYFGDYGSAGSLSGLLWLAAMPESIITGAMYDTVDLIRSLPYNERIDRLLGASRYSGLTGSILGSIIGSQYAADANEQSLQRIDTLTGLLGRDTSFFQQWTSDRYLSVLGNPSLSRLSPKAQIALGFALDSAVGGFSDAFIVEPLFSAMTGSRRAAVRAAQRGSAAPAAPLAVVTPNAPPPGVYPPSSTPPPRTPSGGSNTTPPPPPRPEPEAPPRRPAPEPSQVFGQVPNFSSREQAAAVRQRLFTRLEQDNEALANAATRDERLRISARIATNKQRIAAIDSLTWTTTPAPDVFTRTTPSAVTPAPRNAEAMLELLGSPNAQANDVMGAYLAARNIDINLRRGTDVTPDVTNFRRDGTVVSDIPVARLAPATVQTLPTARVVDLPDTNVQVSEMLGRVRAQIDDTRRQVNRARPFKNWAVDEETGEAIKRLSYPANSDETIFTNLQASLDNLLREEKELSRQLESGDFENYVTRAIAQSDSVVDDMGVITSPSTDRVLDTLLPPVRLSDISPSSAGNLPESIAMQPVVGVDISGREALFVRRTDEELDQLAQLWGVNTSMNVPTNPQAQLANLLRQEVLEREFPNLLRRYGQPVPGELMDSNVNRIVVQDRNITRSQQSVPSSVNRKPAQELQPAVPSELRQARQRVNRLSKAAQRSIDKLAAIRAEFEIDYDAAQRELSRLQSIRSNIDLVYAEYPELAIRNILDSVPAHLRPVGESSATLGAEYAFQLRRFHRENQLFNAIAHELSVTDVLLRQQQQRLLDMPSLARINPGNEFATVRQYDENFDMHGIDEHDIPESTLIADLPPEIVQDMTSKELVTFIQQVSKATPEQARQAIFNGLQAGQLRRENGRYSHTGQTLQDLFKQADAILPSTDDGTVSLAAYKIARDITENIGATYREALEDVVDINLRRRIKEGRTTGLVPGDADLEAPAFSDDVFNRAREASEQYNKTVELFRDTARQISDELTAAKPLSLDAEDVSVDDLDSSEQYLNDVIARYGLDIEPVSGTTPEGQRVFGYETPSGEVVAGAGGEQRLEPLEVLNARPVNSTASMSVDEAMTIMADSLEVDVTFGPRVTVELSASESFATDFPSQFDDKLSVILSFGIDDTSKTIERKGPVPREAVEARQWFMELLSKYGDTVEFQASPSGDSIADVYKKYLMYHRAGFRSIDVQDADIWDAAEPLPLERYVELSSISDTFNNDLQVGIEMIHNSSLQRNQYYNEGLARSEQPPEPAAIEKTIPQNATLAPSGEVYLAPDMVNNRPILRIFEGEETPALRPLPTTDNTLGPRYEKTRVNLENTTDQVIQVALPKKSALAPQEYATLRPGDTLAGYAGSRIEIQKADGTTFDTIATSGTIMSPEDTAPEQAFDNAAREKYLYSDVNEVTDRGVFTVAEARDSLRVGDTVAFTSPLSDVVGIREGVITRIKGAGQAGSRQTIMYKVTDNADPGTPLPSIPHTRIKGIKRDEAVIDVEAQVTGDTDYEATLESNMDTLNLPEIEKFAWREQWKKELYPEAVVWFSDASPKQRTEMRRVGAPYLPPIEANEQEILGLFPNVAKAVEMARGRGFEGDSDFEILARYANVSSVNSAEFANLLPVVRERTNAGTREVLGDGGSTPTGDVNSDADVLPTVPESVSLDAEFDALSGVAPNIVGEALPARVMFHGTHSVQLSPGIKASSPSNELGMGVYVTTNFNEATLHARAQAAQDVVIQGSIRPQFSDTGRVFEVLSPPRDAFPEPESGVPNPSFNDETLELPRPSALDWNVVDASVVAGKANERTVGTMLAYAVKEVIYNYNRANPIPSDVGSKIWRRFSQWSKKHPYREWHQYLRSQLEKEMGEGAQRIVVGFQQDLQNALVRRGVDAIKDGDTYNIVNNLSFFIDKVHPDFEANTDLAGQLAARVEIEKLAFARNPSSTNMVKLEQAYLDYNTFQRNQLADSVAQQEIIATEATRDLGRTERVVEDLVADDRSKMTARQRAEADARADAMADEMFRTDEDCP